MTGDSEDASVEDTYGPIEIDRRTLTKLVGIAGITVTAEPLVSSVEATQTDEVTTMVNIQPTFDNVLVQDVGEDDSTGGGQQTDDELTEGIVRATGDDVVHVSEGDKVASSEGIELTVGGEEHRIVTEEEILVIIED